VSFSFLKLCFIPFLCRLVGQHVASLIPNGATIQMGIGSIPDAVLSALKNHRDLGVHSEMFSDGVVDLVESGAINGSRKSLEPFQIVGSFVVGSQRLIDFVNDNPSVKLLRSSYVNDPHVIRQHEKMHAINSLVQIDLTGQVCADSIGTR
jgi:4-hydroxybutyrate CoA-transferase